MSPSVRTPSSHVFANALKARSSRPSKGQRRSFARSLSSATLLCLVSVGCSTASDEGNSELAAGAGSDAPTASAMPTPGADGNGLPGGSSAPSVPPSPQTPPPSPETGGAPAAGGASPGVAPGPTPVASNAGSAPVGSATEGGMGGSVGGAVSTPGGAGGAASGGAPSGGAGTAGAPAGGAAGAMGGEAAGGSSGGGQSSDGAGSPGCGSATPLESGTFMVDIDGKQRMYVLDVPTNYDPNTPYRLVFVPHPLGGSASQVVSGGYNGLKSLADGSAIFVAPDGQDGQNEMVSGRGWWNQNDNDMKFFTAMLEEFNANLCIDQERIFSTGFSFGGMMSYTVGEQFDVFRAIAPCSGNLTVIPHDQNNSAPLAIMAFHGNNDTFVTTSGGFDALKKYAERNHCGTETMPMDPSPCVEYQGCDVPTIWCEFPGAHEPWSQEPQAIWTFFSQF